MLSPELDVPTAYWFYKNYLLDATRNKAEVYEQYGFLSPSVPFIDWEVFAAILFRDRAKSGYGADLERHEVKSAAMGSSFEYQYHKFRGLDKLEEDQRIDHVFISYANGYQDLDVYYMRAAKIATIFQGWKLELVENYQAGRQRFRKSIPFGYVRREGWLILAIRNGELTHPAQPGGSIYVSPPMQ